MNNLKSYAFCFLAGLLYSLGFPSYIGESLLITPILGMSILWIVWFQDTTIKQKFLASIFFTLSFTLSSFYWIAQTLSEFGELPLWIGILLNALFAFIMIPWMWLVLIGFYFLNKKKVDYKKYLSHPFFIPLMALFVTFLEYFIPQQFPTHIAGPWISLSEKLTLAEIGGLPLYSFMSYLLVFTFVQKFTSKKFSYLPISMVFVFIISHAFVKKDILESVNPIKVRLVQANISNYLKVSSESGEYASVSEVIGRYESLSLDKNEMSKDIDLIIWPETAYPYSLRSYKTYPEDKTFVPNLFKNIMQDQKAELYIGGYDEKENSFALYESEYNSGFLMSDGEIKNVYHKHILIPFGETLPLGPLTKLASGLFSNIAFFAQGDNFPLLELKNKMKFIGAICYEILKPEFIREYLNEVKERPNFLINITNDSWYGKTVEPHQHLFLSRWRAVEFRLPIIRSTNTGISAIINEDGVVTHKLGVFQTGNLDAIFNAGIRAKTTFEKYGFMVILPLFFLLFLFELTVLKLKNEK